MYKLLESVSIKVYFIGGEKIIVLTNDLFWALTNDLFVALLAKCYARSLSLIYHAKNQT